MATAALGLHAPAYRTFDRGGHRRLLRWRFATSASRASDRDQRRVSIFTSAARSGKPDPCDVPTSHPASHLSYQHERYEGGRCSDALGADEITPRMTYRRQTRQATHQRRGADGRRARVPYQGIAVARSADSPRLLDTRALQEHRIRSVHVEQHAWRSDCRHRRHAANNKSTDGRHA